MEEDPETPEEKIVDFNKRLADLKATFLKATDEKARKIIKPFEQDVVSHDQVTAGVSMFYFEEKSRT